MLYMCGVLHSALLGKWERIRILKGKFLGSEYLRQRQRQRQRQRGMGGGQALKRIPRIKFPQRHPKSSPSASASGTQASSSASDAGLSFFSSSKASATVGGKASLQPKRTSVSNEEIEAILLGGCF